MSTATRRGPVGKFIQRLRQAAARSCRIFDTGGEYAYQRLLPHLPFHDDGTLFLICVPLDADVDQHVSLWFDVFDRLSIVDLRVLFVATKGHGTLVEMRRFHRQLLRALESRQCAFRYAYQVAMLVMRSNQKCFMQHYYHVTEGLLAQLAADVASTSTLVGEDAMAHALHTVHECVTFESGAAAASQRDCPERDSLFLALGALQNSGFEWAAAIPGEVFRCFPWLAPSGVRLADQDWIDATCQWKTLMTKRMKSVFFTDFAAFKATHDEFVAQLSIDESVTSAVTLIRFCRNKLIFFAQQTAYLMLGHSRR